MYDRILFPTDEDTATSPIVDHVLDIAAFHEAKLHVLYVADTTHDSVTRIGTDVIDTLETKGREAVSSVVDRAEERGIETITEILQGGVATSIADHASETAIDLITMPTRGREGFEETLIGSTTERVIRQADVPVLTFPPDETRSYPYADILIPTDGSDAANRALTFGVSLAQTPGAALHLLSVIEVDTFGADLGSERYAETLESRAAQIIDEATATAERDSVETVVSSVEWNASVTNAIREYADENDVEVGVMSTHGRTGLERYLLGSVTEKVIRTLSRPVLTVPASTRGGGDR